MKDFDMKSYEKPEVLEALQTPDSLCTPRQFRIRYVYGLLYVEENKGRTRTDILEELAIKHMRGRRNKIIKASEYRELISAIELFYFN